MLRLGDITIVYATWIPLLLAALCLLIAWRGFRSERVLWRPPASLLAIIALLCLGAGFGGMPVGPTSPSYDPAPAAKESR